MRATPLPARPDVDDGSPAVVVQAAVRALRERQRAALAVVLETEGSTYTRAGTLVLFTGAGHVGWLSGGCLEPEIERRALEAADQAQLAWMEIDSRDDASLFAGNAVGCRGLQRVALLPLGALPGIEAVLTAWLEGVSPLTLHLQADGRIRMACNGIEMDHVLPSAPVDWPAPQPAWQLQWRRAPTVVLLGAGPEAAPLVPLLTGLGWRVAVHEPRAAWRERSAVPARGGSLAALLDRMPPADAVLVMHHNFELDRDALEALADSAVPFIGLLGPVRRRDDLFKLLPETAREALQPRLHAPIGLALGGRGPDAIALSIAAQLHAWRHGVTVSLR